ncbi:MAG: hypothetical protein HUU55_17795 [Myxococcales bacterium]|nr:hypothetical protein [Myxococcales bacterium]
MMKTYLNLIHIFQRPTSFEGVSMRTSLFSLSGTALFGATLALAACQATPSPDTALMSQASPAAKTQQTKGILQSPDDAGQEMKFPFGAEVLTIDTSKTLQFNPKELPLDSKGEPFGVLPAEFEGDGFFMSVHHPAPKAEESSEQVFNQYVYPVLKANGLELATQTLQPDPAPSVSNGGNLKLQLRDAVMAYGTDARKLKKMVAAAGGLDKVMDDMLQIGEGTTLQGFIQDLTIPQVHHVWRQTYDGIPVEGAMITATARQGQGIHSIRGTAFNNISPLNEVAFEADTAEQIALSFISDHFQLENPSFENPQLVLMPAQSGHLYAWRLQPVDYSFSQEIPPKGTFPDQQLLFNQTFNSMIWIDASSGEILAFQVNGIGAEVGGAGRAFNRDPGTGPSTGGNPTVTTYGFQVDGASGGNYQLKLSNVINRVDRGGDGGSNDVSISSSNNGSSASYANFDQSPLNTTTGRRTVCAQAASHNAAFSEVDFYAAIYKVWSRAIGNGVINTDTIKFPRSAWSPKVNRNFCNANASMDYGAGDCFFSDSACPDCTDTGGCSSVLNFAHDHTIVAHELAHNIGWQQFCQRPGCGPDCTGTCGTGPSWHDLADLWAATYEENPCIAGWSVKNDNGIDNSLYCNPLHDEGGWLPRLLSPADRFPEHMDLNGDGTTENDGEYANMQIGSYALWEVRQGMKSRCPPSGVPAFERRLMLALQSLSHSYTAPVGSDSGVYQAFRALLREMVNQWATSTNTGTYENGSPSTNKVTAGFAKAGIFLVARDAVIDVDDNDSGDSDVDWLSRTDAPPTFHVWTGERHGFSGNNYTFPAILPCNNQFRVAASNSSTFGAGTVWSAWTDATDCKGTFTLSEGDWNTLKGASGVTKLYYKAETRNQTILGTTSTRSSVSPGNGAFSVPAAYAMVNDTGTEGGCSAGGAQNTSFGVLLMSLALAHLWYRRRRA